MLRRLQRHVDAVLRRQLPRPHAGAVDDALALDVAVGRAHAGHRAALGEHLGAAGTSSSSVAPCSLRALGHRHGDVDRVHPAVLLHVEAGVHVVDLRQREQLLHLLGRDLLHVDAAGAVEGRHPAVLLQAILVGGHLDEAHRLEAGRLARLRLQPRVEVAGVLAHLGRGLGGRAEGDHQPGRVPGGARGQPVALEQHGVFPAQVGQVVGDRRSDDAASDDDDARALRQDWWSHVGAESSLTRCARTAETRRHPADVTSCSIEWCRNSAGRRIHTTRFEVHPVEAGLTAPIPWTPGLAGRAVVRRAGSGEPPRRGGKPCACCSSDPTWSRTSRCATSPRRCARPATRRASPPSTAAEDAPAVLAAGEGRRTWSACRCASRCARSSSSTLARGAQGADPTPADHRRRPLRLVRRGRAARPPPRARPRRRARGRAGPGRAGEPGARSCWRDAGRWPAWWCGARAGRRRPLRGRSSTTSTSCRCPDRSGPARLLGRRADRVPDGQPRLRQRLRLLLHHHPAPHGAGPAASASARPRTSPTRWPRSTTSAACGSSSSTTTTSWCPTTQHNRARIERLERGAAARRGGRHRPGAQVQPARRRAAHSRSGCKELGLIRIFMGIESGTPVRARRHRAQADGRRDNESGARRLCEDLGISSQYTLIILPPRGDAGEHAGGPRRSSSGTRRTRSTTAAPRSTRARRSRARMLAEGRAIGDYLGRTYRYTDPRVERTWEVGASCSPAAAGARTSCWAR